MHIFGADISTVCGFDLKYDTTLLKSWAKKIDHKPNKDETLEEGRHLRLDKIKETVPNVLLHCRVCLEKKFSKST